MLKATAAGKQRIKMGVNATMTLDTVADVLVKYGKDTHMIVFKLLRPKSHTCTYYTYWDQHKALF